MYLCILLTYLLVTRAAIFRMNYIDCKHQTVMSTDVKYCWTRFYHRRAVYSVALHCFQANILSVFLCIYLYILIIYLLVTYAGIFHMIYVGGG